MSKAIVVGVDGSAESKHALEWALAEARLRQATVRAVLVSQVPPLAVSAGMDGTSAGGYYLAEVARAAERRLEQAIAEAVPDAGGVEIERSVVEGSPAATLVALAHDADLLVVGSRGLGGFKGLLLGSVSQQCAQHAACPVVITRRGIGPEPERWVAEMNEPARTGDVVQ